MVLFNILIVCIIDVPLFTAKFRDHAKGIPPIFSSAFQHNYPHVTTVKYFVHHRFIVGSSYCL